jgi:hypothetical protein
MDAGLDGPPVVELPERVDRRVRLGPFASARDALKFVTYAAVGAVLVPFTTPYLWLAIVGAGFALCVVRSEGRAMDEHVATYLLWRFRSMRRRRSVAPLLGPPARRGLVGLGSGQFAVILRTGGTPIAYLPPTELARRFDQFRELLRSLRGSLGLSVTSAPMIAGPVTPTPIDASCADAEARDGYTELVSVLCRRRSVRRIDLVLTTEASGVDSIADLETRASALTARLSEIGVRSVRLQDRVLGEAARRWGWTWVRSVR